MQINNDGYTYIIKKNYLESENIFHKRMWYIVNQKPKNKEEYIKASEIASLIINIDILNCDYGCKINNFINDIKKKYNILDII